MFNRLTKPSQVEPVGDLKGDVLLRELQSSIVTPEGIELTGGPTFFRVMSVSREVEVIVKNDVIILRPGFAENSKNAGAVPLADTKYLFIKASWVGLKVDKQPFENM